MQHDVQTVRNPGFAVATLSLMSIIPVTKSIPDGSEEPGSAIAVYGNGTSFGEHQQRHLLLCEEHLQPPTPIGFAVKMCDVQIPESLKDSN